MILFSFFEENFVFKKHHFSIRESNDQEKIYPPSITSSQRKKIHGIAESLRLYHSSIGEGNERQIKISKGKEKKVNNFSIKIEMHFFFSKK